MPHPKAKQLRETLERARFHHRNGRPGHALFSLLDVADLLVSAAEAEPEPQAPEPAGADIRRDLARRSRTPRPAAAAPDALALGDGGVPS